ncbi:hypothetical protein GV64_22815 [Endozoicomonas elysicola]|uniref:Uncharacterized protein n=1 Tax=Endozoicomonas elysicola TaxID=305900 RepID=A0A081KG88_9GAMM|nr:hypothetical protein GV64_22815 [Endozoicomonas elysicola]
MWLAVFCYLQADKFKPDTDYSSCIQKYIGFFGGSWYERLPMPALCLHGVQFRGFSKVESI